jgi:hypothetical protein
LRSVLLGFLRTRKRAISAPLSAGFKVCPCSLNLLWARRRDLREALRRRPGNDARRLRRCLKASCNFPDPDPLRQSQFSEPASPLWTDGRSATDIRRQASSGQETPVRYSTSNFPRFPVRHHVTDPADSRGPSADAVGKRLLIFGLAKASAGETGRGQGSLQAVDFKRLYCRARPGWQRLAALDALPQTFVQTMSFYASEKERW